MAIRKFAVCDHPSHEGDEPAVSKRRIVIGGRAYEPDLCMYHAAELDAALQPYAHRTARTPESRRYSREVREWWKEHPEIEPRWTGSERGRIPVRVAEQYRRRRLGAGAA